MGIQSSSVDPHWNYFLALEEDLVRLARFVEFSKTNYQTYSIEMARLLLATASEVDVVMKLRCRQIGSDASSIGRYREVLRTQRPILCDMNAFIPRYGLTLAPWRNWLSDKNPDWWTDHNKVKHARDENFTRANLKNVLNATGGLFLLLLAYYVHESDRQRLVPVPSLFYPPEGIAIRGHALDGETGLFLLDE
jgi:hypothetical protein